MIFLRTGVILVRGKSADPPGMVYLNSNLTEDVSPESYLGSCFSEKKVYKLMLIQKWVRARRLLKRRKNFYFQENNFRLEDKAV